jgi:hypothetical protein
MSSSLPPRFLLVMWFMGCGMLTMLSTVGAYERGWAGPIGVLASASWGAILSWCWLESSSSRRG